MPNDKLSLNNVDDLTVQECFEEYINRCIIRNLSEETVKLYRNQFSVFYRTLDNPEKMIKNITIKDIDCFILEERKGDTCNEVTTHSLMSCLTAR